MISLTGFSIWWGAESEFRELFLAPIDLVASGGRENADSQATVYYKMSALSFHEGDGSATLTPESEQQCKFN